MSRLHVAGVPIDPLSVQEMLHLYEGFIRCGRTHVVHHIPADPIVIARRDAAFIDVLGRADLNLPDGMGVVWAARLLGAKHLRRRLYGPDCMLLVLEWGIERGLRHAFVGGSPDLLNALQVNLIRRFPGLRVVGAHAPPMRAVTPDAVHQDLEGLGVEADVLWVGLGTPKQQIWAELARNHRPAHVIATVGAAFDFVSGAKSQAPRWVQAVGLEWAFRLAIEPRRLWRRYLVGNPLFIAAVFRDVIRTRRGADH